MSPARTPSSDCRETGARDASRGIGTAEMIDHDFGAAFADRRQYLREQRPFQIDLDVPVEAAHVREQLPVIRGSRRRAARSAGSS